MLCLKPSVSKKLLNAHLKEVDTPTYPFKCACGHKADIIKPIRDHDTPEPCDKCGALMSKDYGDPGWAKAGKIVFNGHFNQSLGQYVGSARDVKDAQNKIKDETGSMPVEIGNERPKFAPALTKEPDMREVISYAESLQTARGETPHV